LNGGGNTSTVSQYYLILLEIFFLFLFQLFLLRPHSAQCEERRSSLAPETVEAITCLKDWKRVEDRKQHQLEDPEIEQAYADFSHD
jgi:hypothetical protein